MTNSQRLATVRTRLLQWLAEHGCQDGDGQVADAAIESESLLIRDEFYCGRRFHTARHQAVWFIEEDELKIYQKNGRLLCVLHSDGIDQAQEAAKMVQGHSAGNVQSPTESREIIKLPMRASSAADDSGDQIRRAA